MTQNVPASVKAKLLAGARESGEEFERTLTRFAAERFLFRLGRSPARERCVLKGASLLTVWLADPYRMTRDIDVLAHGATDDGAIRAMLEQICAVPCPDDGLSYELAELRLEPIRAEEEYSGKRAEFVCLLGNARIKVQVDFGFGDALASEPEEIEYPTMLEGLGRATLRAYPRNSSIAEKIEAMVKLGRRNSRMKDFHDVWALTETFDFEGPSLKQAVEACFQRRGTTWADEVPEALTPAFYEDQNIASRWRSYRAAGAVLVLPPEQFEVIGERVRAFVNPARDSVVGRSDFDRRWSAGGPWR